MANINIIYPLAKKLIPSGDINLTTSVIKVALMNNYTYDPAHDYWNDVSSYEISPTGSYPAGGVALMSKVINLDILNEEGYFDAADLVLGTGMTAQFQQIVIYKDTGTPSTSPLIGCILLESKINLSSQGCKIVWHNDGIMRFL